jgi:hypothetical protein
MAGNLKPQAAKPEALKPMPGPARDDQNPAVDPLDPLEDRPSDLDDRTHAEFIEIYRDASANIRFSKEQMWRVLLYFSLGAIAVTGYGVVSRWSDPLLTYYLLVIVWVCSIISVLIVLSLQWWQAAEHRKIEYVTAKWSLFSNTARARKPKLMSDVQRYGMLVAMILYMELVTIAVTRIFLLHL